MFRSNAFGACLSRYGSKSGALTRAENWKVLARQVRAVNLHGPFMKGLVPLESDPSSRGPPVSGPYPKGLVFFHEGTGPFGQRPFFAEPAGQGSQSKGTGPLGVKSL